MLRISGSWLPEEVVFNPEPLKAPVLARVAPPLLGEDDVWLETESSVLLESAGGERAAVVLNDTQALVVGAVLERDVFVPETGVMGDHGVKRLWQNTNLAAWELH